MTAEPRRVHLTRAAAFADVRHVTRFGSQCFSDGVRAALLCAVTAPPVALGGTQLVQLLGRVFSAGGVVSPVLRKAFLALLGRVRAGFAWCPVATTLALLLSLTCEKHFTSV